MSRSKSICILGILFLASCGSGIGLAARQALSGTPFEVVTGFDALDAEYDLRANYEMKDIVASPVPEGNIQAAANKSGAVNDMQSRIDAFHKITNDLRTYLGITAKGDPLASINAAAENRAKILKAGLDAMNKNIIPK